MSAVVDVSYPVFQALRRQDPVFFWLEQKNRFVLLKPKNNVWMRTTIKRTGTHSDYAWAFANLFSVEGAVRAEKISGINDSDTLRDILKEIKGGK